MDFDIGLRSSRLEIKSCEVRRFSSGGINLSELLGRRAVIFRATEPDEVGELDTSAEEVVTSVDTKDCAKAVLQVVLDEVRSCACTARM